MGKRRKYREELDFPPIDEFLFGEDLKIDNYYIDVGYGYEEIGFITDSGMERILLIESELLATRVRARLRELGVRIVDSEAERKSKRQD